MHQPPGKRTHTNPGLRECRECASIGLHQSGYRFTLLALRTHSGWAGQSIQTPLAALFTWFQSVWFLPKRCSGDGGAGGNRKRPASEMVARLSRLVTELIGSYNLDPGRVYVTGFSMGGDGTWALGIAHPEQFAALLPVSRWYRKYDLVCALKALPVHVYQSELDEVVPAPIAKKMTADLEVCGGNVQLTLFPEGRHNETCGIAYARDEIYQWLDAQKKE